MRRTSGLVRETVIGSHADKPVWLAVCAGLHRICDLKAAAVPWQPTELVQLSIPGCLAPATVKHPLLPSFEALDCRSVAAAHAHVDGGSATHQRNVRGVRDRAYVPDMAVDV